MGIRLLGPMEVVGARPLEPRDRVVLGVLAVRCRHVVSPGQIGEAVWGDDPPASWPKQVQICIARLRRLLGKEAIETVGGGYRLMLEGDDVDADHFARLVERADFLAAAGESEEAASTYGRALSMWRGDPLDDLDGWEPARSEVVRLTELRRSAQERWLDARLAAGDHRAAVADAHRLVDEEPLRERRWATLALAQYRCARQTDALRTLARARRVLVEQVGADPGPELAALEAGVLHHDPGLAPPPLSGAERKGTCPYKGLAAYDEADAEQFFGRRDEVAMCEERLRASRLLVVAGASGCGKSSLVRAGLVPHLRQRGLDALVFVPGPDPVGAVEAASCAAPAVLVVDQFEELFEFGHGDAVIAGVLCRLAARALDGTDVVLVVRDDHLGDIGADADLRRLIERGLHLVSPLSGHELRAAIESPAARAGLRVERQLVDLLVGECAGDGTTLPLLSHVLVETWRHREGNTLTVGGYLRTGGLHGAVARSADRLYDGLSDDDRDTLRSVVLRLVTPSVAGEPVRCRVPSRSLLGSPGRERVVALLVRAGLVTAHDGEFEVAHEALARAWPRLQAWLDDDVSGQRALRHLVVAASGWDSIGRPDAELYRGARLATAVEWRRTRAPELTDVEAAFLDASSERDGSEERQLAARAARDARQNRRLKVLLVAAVASLVAVIVAGAVALTARDRADTERRIAITRELAAAAVANLDVDVERSVLLALAAVDRAGPGDGPAQRVAEDALHRAVTTSRLERRIGGAGGRVDWASDGDHLAALGPPGSRTVELRDVATGALRTTFETGSADATDIAFNPAGRTLGVTTGAGEARIVDLASGATMHVVDGEGVALGPSFSSDGSTFAAAWPDDGGGLVRVTSTATGEARELPSLPGAQFTAFDPGGTTLGVAGTGAAGVRVVDLATEATVVEVDGPREGSFGVTGVAWSPDGRSIAMSADDGSARVFDAATGTQQIAIPGHGSLVTAVGWGSGGQLLATASADGTAKIWSVNEGGGRELMTLAAQDVRAGVTDIAFSPDGTRVATTGRDGASVLIWDVGLSGGAEIANLPGVAFMYGSARFDSSGSHLVVTAPGGRIAVWDAGTLHSLGIVGPAGGSPPAPSAIPGVPLASPGDVTTVVPSPDGQLVATLADQGRIFGDGSVPVWDVKSGELAFTADGGSHATWAEWSPEGNVLAVAGENAISIVDRAGREKASISVPGVLIGSLTFLPDGDRLVATTESLGEYDPADAAVVVWDWRTGAEVDRIDVEAWNVVPLGDGDRIVLAPHHQARSQVVIVWDLSSDRAVTRIGGQTGQVNAVAVDPASVRIATAGGDGSLRVWDAATGGQLLDLRGHIGVVTSASFDATGTRLVSTGVDGRVRVWALDRDELVDIAKERVTRPLTAEECTTYLRTLDHPLCTTR